MTGWCSRCNMTHELGLTVGCPVYRTTSIGQPCPACAEKDAEIARLTGLVHEQKGGPCETCRHSYQRGSDFTRCTNAGGVYCLRFGNGCYAWEARDAQGERAPKTTDS